MLAPIKKDFNDIIILSCNVIIRNILFLVWDGERVYMPAGFCHCDSIAINAPYSVHFSGF